MSTLGRKRTSVHVRYRPKADIQPNFTDEATRRIDRGELRSALGYPKNDNGRRIRTARFRNVVVQSDES